MSWLSSNSVRAKRTSRPPVRRLRQHCAVGILIQCLLRQPQRSIWSAPRHTPRANRMSNSAGCASNDPVHWHEQKNARGFWAVTRYQDVWAIGRDAKTYSSYAGGIMLDDPDRVFASAVAQHDAAHGPARSHALPHAGQQGVHSAQCRPRLGHASRSWRKKSSTMLSSAANAT